MAPPSTMKDSPVKYLNPAIVLCFAISGCSSAQTLEFKGVIDAKSADEAIEKIKHGASKIVITSQGGETEASLRLAEKIQQLRIPVTVRGYCLSACASYIFVASPQRFVEQGAIVAFHNTSSSYERVARHLNAPEVIAAVSPRAERERSLYTRANVSLDLLVEPEARIGPICMAFAAPKPGGVRQGYMHSRANFWIPDIAQARRLGLDVQGSWPASREDLYGRLVSLKVLNKLTFGYGDIPRVEAVGDTLDRVPECDGSAG